MQHVQVPPRSLSVLEKEQKRNNEALDQEGKKIMDDYLVTPSNPSYCQWPKSPNFKALQKIRWGVTTSGTLVVKEFATNLQTCRTNPNKLFQKWLKNRIIECNKDYPDHSECWKYKEWKRKHAVEMVGLKQEAQSKASRIFQRCCAHMRRH